MSGVLDGTRRRTAVVAVLGLLAAVAVVLALTSRDGSGGTDGTGGAVGAPVASPTGTSLAEAMAGDQVPQTAETAGGVVATGVPRSPNPAPLSVVTESDGAVVGANGCLVTYGDGGECLPAVPQSAAEMGMTRQQMPWQCEEVNLTFPDGLPVATGGDTLGLDSDGDGVACDAGDEPGRAGSHSH